MKRITVTGAALALAAYAAHAAPAPAPAPVRPALEKQDIRAELSPRRFTTIAAEIGGRISRIPVTEGGRFKAGQLLVTLDCAMQQAQLQKARAVLDAAEKTRAANVRLEELHSIGKIELQVSESEAAKARADVVANGVVLSKCAISAPFSGRVSEQKAREQQYVQPGQALLEIIDDSVLELAFIVPSHWLAWIRTGAVFQVRIDETGKTYPARIGRIGARVDPVSQSVKLSAAIDGTFPELISGMSGRIILAPPAGQ